MCARPDVLLLLLPRVVVGKLMYDTATVVVMMEPGMGECRVLRAEREGWRVGSSSGKYACITSLSPLYVRSSSTEFRFIHSMGAFRTLASGVFAAA